MRWQFVNQSLVSYCGKPVRQDQLLDNHDRVASFYSSVRFTQKESKLGTLKLDQSYEFWTLSS